MQPRERLGAHNDAASAQGFLNAAEDVDAARAAGIVTGWYGRAAPLKARKIAQELAQAGDHGGHQIWLKVGEIAEALLKNG